MEGRRAEGRGARKKSGVPGGAWMNAVGGGVTDNGVQKGNQGNGLMQEVVNSMYSVRKFSEGCRCTKRKSSGCDKHITSKIKAVEQEEDDGKQRDESMNGPEEESDVERVGVKLHTLKERYRGLKESKEQTGDTSGMWLFFEQLDAVLGDGFNDKMPTPPSTCPNPNPFPNLNPNPFLSRREEHGVEGGRVEGEGAGRGGAEEGDGSGRSGFGSARWRGQHVMKGPASIDLNRPGEEVEFGSDYQRRAPEKDAQRPLKCSNNKGAEKRAHSQTDTATVCTNPNLARPTLQVEFRDIILAMVENRRKIAEEKIAHEESEAKRAQAQGEEAKVYLREEREREMLFEKEMTLLEFEKDRKRKQSKRMEMKAERAHVENMLKMENERLRLNLQAEEKKLQQEQLRLQQEVAKYKLLLVQRELQGGDSAMAISMDDHS